MKQKYWEVATENRLHFDEDRPLFHTLYTLHNHYPIVTRQSFSELDSSIVFPHSSPRQIMQNIYDMWSYTP